MDKKKLKLNEEQVTRKRLMLDQYKLQRDEIEINLEMANKKAEKKIAERAHNLAVRDGQLKVKTLERNIKVLEKQIRTKEETEIIFPVD